MKRSISVILLICIMGLIFVGCGGYLLEDSEFQIKVSGTSGLEFSGVYGVTTSAGNYIAQSVDDVVPTEYSVEGAMVSVVFQKKAGDGNLKVEILRAGEKVAESSTSARYGVVQVGTD